jgi:hypothetical protein
MNEQRTGAATIPEHTQLLARLVIAYGGFRLAECAAWVAVAAYAYEHDGATGAAVACAVQLAPASVAALMIGKLVARRGAGRTLFAGYVIQSFTLGATATGARVEPRCRSFMGAPPPLRAPSPRPAPLKERCTPACSEPARASWPPTW